MIRINNLTNRLIKFQGQSIPAYGYLDFALVTDMIGLARLLNSGKISYNQYYPETENTEVVEEPVKVAVDEVVEETLVTEEPVKEESEPVIIDETPAEESIIPTVEDTEPKSKGNRRKSKKESADE